MTSSGADEVQTETVLPSAGSKAEKDKLKRRRDPNTSDSNRRLKEQIYIHHALSRSGRKADTTDICCREITL